MKNPVKEFREKEECSRASRAREEEIKLLAEQQRRDAELGPASTVETKLQESAELARLLLEAQQNGLKIQKVPLGKSSIYDRYGQITEYGKKTYRQRFYRARRRKPTKKEE